MCVCGRAVVQGDCNGGSGLSMWIRRRWRSPRGRACASFCRLVAAVPAHVSQASISDYADAFESGIKHRRNLIRKKPESHIAQGDSLEFFVRALCGPIPVASSSWSLNEDVVLNAAVASEWSGGCPVQIGDDADEES